MNTHFSKTDPRTKLIKKPHPSPHRVLKKARPKINNRKQAKSGQRAATSLIHRQLFRNEQNDQNDQKEQNNQTTHLQNGPKHSSARSLSPLSLISRLSLSASARSAKNIVSRRYFSIELPTITIPINPSSNQAPNSANSKQNPQDAASSKIPEEIRAPDQSTQPKRSRWSRYGFALLGFYMGTYAAGSILVPALVHHQTSFEPVDIVNWWGDGTENVNRVTAYFWVVDALRRIFPWFEAKAVSDPGFVEDVSVGLVLNDMLDFGRILIGFPIVKLWVDRKMDRLELEQQQQQQQYATAEVVKTVRDVVVDTSVVDNSTPSSSLTKNPTQSVGKDV